MLPTPLLLHADVCSLRRSPFSITLRFGVSDTTIFLYGQLFTFMQMQNVYTYMSAISYLLCVLGETFTKYMR